jgi:hypothetical protein
MADRKAVANRDGSLNAIRGETHMKTLPLRSTVPHAADPDEFDFPLPVADPAVRPMHRQCVLKGCAYRSRFLFGAGWVLAVLFFVTTLATGLYSARSQEALLKENALLSQQIAAQGEQRVTRFRPPVPTKQEQVTAAAPPSPPEVAPQVRKRVPPKKSKEYPPIPKSEPSGVTHVSRLPESDGFLLSIRPDDQKE